MDNSYLLYKSLHILGVILFVGNIIITGWWKVMADRTRNPVIIAYAQRQVTLTDYVFTAGGSALVLITGVINAQTMGLVVNHGVAIDLSTLTLRWLANGYWLFVVSGILWVLGLFLSRSSKLAWHEPSPTAASSLHFTGSCAGCGCGSVF